MSLSLALYAPPPGFVEQRTQATKNDKGATNGTAYGNMLTLFDAKRGVSGVTNNIIVISGYCNSVLRRRQYFCWAIGLERSAHPESARGLSNIEDLYGHFESACFFQKGH